ncbi:MAG: ABC transporter permease [Bacillota bacterium]|nr:ABC transporter permease [Bacillota bacterium]
MSGLASLILTNVRRNLARTTLTVVGMGLAALIMTASLTLSEGYPAAAYEAYRSYLGGDILIYAEKIWVRGSDINQSESGTWQFARLTADVPGPAGFFQPHLAAGGYLRPSAAPKGFFSQDAVRELAARLAAAGLAGAVRPYFTLPAAKTEFAGGTGTGFGGSRPDAAVGASPYVYTDSYLRAWDTGDGWPSLAPFVVAGRSLGAADEGRLVCLVDATRGKLAQLPGMDFPPEVPRVGETLRVLLPRLSVDLAGQPRLDYIGAVWVELEVVGHYAVPTREATWIPPGRGEGGATEPEAEQLYLTSPEIIIPWDTAEALLDVVSEGAADLWASALAVEVGSLARVESAVTALAKLFPDLGPVSVPRQAAVANAHWLPEPVFRVPESEWRSAQPSGQVGEPVRISAAFNMIFFAIAALLAAANAIVLVLERQREIGILKAIGASSREVMLMVLGEVVLLSSLGAAGGFVLAEAMAVWNLISNGTPALAVLLFVGSDMARVLGLTVSFALVFGLLPAMRTTGMTAMEVLRKE